MLKRQYAKSAGFALSLIVPMLPLLGYTQLGSAWLTPILFFLVLPLLGRALGSDKSSALNPAHVTPALRAYYRWVPRLYLPIWVFSLVWTVQVISKPDVTFFTVLGLGFSAAIGSAIASATSHELMHRESRVDTWLSRLMVSLIAYPHYIREHFYHHRHVGIPSCGLSARVGENLWSFLLRVLPEGISAANALEKELLTVQRKTFWHSSVLQNSLMVLIWASIFFWIAEATGLIFFVLQAVFSIIAIQAINYIQHYGLARIPGEPVGHDLSWEDNCPIANCLTLNINHHSHHHLKPNLPYFALSLDTQSPRLPGSYMVMFMVAIIPPFWRKIMDARLIAYLKHQGAPPHQRGGECLNALGELLR